MKTKYALVLILLIGLSACKLSPFAKYYLPTGKNDLPKFKKNDFEKGTNSSLRACFDLKYYDWTIEPNAENKSIVGKMKIGFTAIQSQDSIMLDMEKSLKVDSIISSKKLLKWIRKGNFLYLIFEENLVVNQNENMEIYYHGKPKNIMNQGPIQWRKDVNGKDWICTQTQGIGPEYMMPCKSPLIDEPDSCFIRVKTKNNLVGVANGKLDSISVNGDFKTYHWSVKNPINIYNISFNIGDYVSFQKIYTDVNLKKWPITVYTPRDYEEKAKELYDVVPKFMAYFERTFGTFPWWNDGCKFVESTLQPGSGMEHQSAISMGYTKNVPLDISRYILAHELAHEWWGNSITGADYADAWLHEGFAEFCAALAMESVYGKEVYQKMMARFIGRTDNERPILKTENVNYNSWLHKHDGDIYSKGALLLHTLRNQLNNDSLFFKTLNYFYEKHQKSNVSTQQFIDFFNQSTNQDFSAIFNLYLKQTKVPTLEFKTFVDGDNQVIIYNWDKATDISVNLKVEVICGDKKYSITPSKEKKALEISNTNSPITFNRVYNPYINFKKQK